MAWTKVDPINTDWSGTTPKFSPYGGVSGTHAAWGKVSPRASSYAESLGRYLLGGPAGVNYTFSEYLRFGGANIPNDPTTTDWS